MSVTKPVLGAEMSLSARDRAVIDAIDEDELVGLLRDLVKVPSENPPGTEAACVRHIAQFLEARGVTSRTVKVEPGRPNLYAELGSGRPTLVLNGHLDTVPKGEGWGPILSVRHSSTARSSAAGRAT